MKYNTETINEMALLLAEIDESSHNSATKKRRKDRLNRPNRDRDARRFATGW